MFRLGGDLMEYSEIISTLGFPIFMCVGVCLVMFKIIMMEREENTKREERMYKINEKLSEALDNNTKAIQELTLFIKNGNEKGD